MRGGERENGSGLETRARPLSRFVCCIIPYLKVEDEVRSGPGLGTLKMGRLFHRIGFIFVCMCVFVLGCYLGLG